MERIYVKHMIGVRCVDKIERELSKLGLAMAEISQGIVEFYEDLTFGQILMVKEGILNAGLEVLDVADSRLLDRITETIRTLIYRHPEMGAADYPAYLKRELEFSDSYIRDVFMPVYGMELVQYIVIRQVERIKEMILYEDRKPGEITETFRFRSKAQLERIFKNITGLTPSFYVEISNLRMEVRRANGLM